MTSNASSLLERMSAARDVRVDDWPLMASPLPTIALSALYGVAATVWGPAFMRRRNPMQLKNCMIAYNLFMVLFSSYMFHGFLVNGWLQYSWTKCTSVDTSTSPKAIGMASITWWFFMSKFIEFLDTFFMIARKKFEQVSFLHVYHHLLTAFFTWIIVRFTPGGSPTFAGPWNTFVHIIMYSYYFLASFGPAVQPYLWWKKHLTKLQMIQFICVFSHSAIVILSPPDKCSIPWPVTVMLGFHAAFLLMLFGSFYVQAFRKKRGSPKVAQDQNGQKKVE